MTRPDLFIVGAPKCGTAWLHEHLKQHPEVFMSPVKEPLFFCDDLDIRSIWRIRDTLAYAALFEGACGARRVGESTGWYLYSSISAAAIRDFSPDARIVVMLRNPVDAMYSLHGHFLWNSNEDIHDFGEALAAVETRRHGRHIPADAHHPTGLLYPEVYRYAPQLRRFLASFGRERVHVVIHDELHRDPPAVYRDVLAFLDLPQIVPDHLEIVNPAKPVYPRLSRFLARRPSLRRLINRAVPLPLLWKVAGLLPYLAQPLPRTGVDPALRATWAPRFAEDLAETSRLVGRDLTGWARP